MRAQPHIVGARGSNEYYGAIGAPGTRAQIGWSAWMRDYTSADDFIRPLFSCPGVVAADPSLTSNYSGGAIRISKRRSAPPNSFSKRIQWRARPRGRPSTE
jgi:hypothetical protein